MNDPRGNDDILGKNMSRVKIGTKERRMLVKEHLQNIAKSFLLPNGFLDGENKSVLTSFCFFHFLYQPASL